MVARIVGTAWCGSVHTARATAPHGRLRHAVPLPSPFRQSTDDRSPSGTDGMLHGAMPSRCAKSHTSNGEDTAGRGHTDRQPAWHGPVRPTARPHRPGAGDAAPPLVAQSLRRLDIHLFALDKVGNGALGPPELGYSYPAGALSGSGLVDDWRVQCIAPGYITQFKTSFEPRHIDMMDVFAICNKFGIPNPYGRTYP